MNMTRKERHLVYEVIAIGAAGLVGVMVVPALLSVRDSFAVLGGAMLTAGWLGWLAYFVYRVK